MSDLKMRSSLHEERISTQTDLKNVLFTGLFHVSEQIAGKESVLCSTFFFPANPIGSFLGCLRSIFILDTVCLS